MGFVFGFVDAVQCVAGAGDTRGDDIITAALLGPAGLTDSRPARHRQVLHHPPHHYEHSLQGRCARLVWAKSGGLDSSKGTACPGGMAERVVRPPSGLVSHGILTAPCFQTMVN